MARNYELDRLKSEKQEAYERKQAAWQKWREAQERTDRAYDAMQEAWGKKNSARDEMNREFEARKAAFERNDTIWDEYKRVRDNNNYHLDYLRPDADAEHQAMISCFEQASAAYESGDKASASLYSSEGHDHQDKRDSLNAEVSRLIQEIRDAKARAEMMTSTVDSSAFHAAKDRFEAAKIKHQAAQAEFNCEKEMRNSAKAEFERLQAEFVRLNEAYKAKRQEVMAEKEVKKAKADQVIAVATGHFAGKNAKVRRREDGMTDIFFSSGEFGDGPGHGHVVVDQNGSVRYARDEWQDKRTDYLIDDRRDDHTKI